MVLDSLLHHQELFGREPALEPCIGHQNLSAGDVVNGSWSRQSQIVIGGDDIDHIDIGTRLLGQL